MSRDRKEFFDKEQNARLESLSIRAKDEDFRKELLSFSDIEEAKEFCEKNDVNVTVDDLTALGSYVYEVSNLDDIVGGVNIGEKIGKFFKEKGINLAVSSALVATIALEFIGSAAGKQGIRPSNWIDKAVKKIKKK